MTATDPVDALRARLAGAGFDRQPQVRIDLVEALFDRYQAGEGDGDRADLEEARYHAEWTLAVVPQTSSHWFAAQFALRNVCTELWEQSEDGKEDLARALSAARVLVAYEPVEVEDRLRLGDLLLSSYELSDRTDDDVLDESVVALTWALESDPDEHEHVVAEIRLGQVLEMRECQRLMGGNATIEVLERPIDLLTRNLGKSGGSGMTDGIRYSLARLHTFRYHDDEFRRSGADSAELRLAIEYLDAIEVEDPDVTENLATALYLRHLDFADPMDADHGIWLLTTSHDKTGGMPESHREVLGSFYLERAKHEPTEDNVDGAIRFLEEARRAGDKSGSALLEAYSLRAAPNVADFTVVVDLLDELLAEDVVDSVRQGWLDTVREVALIEVGLRTDDRAVVAAGVDVLLAAARHASSLDEDLPFVLGLGVALLIDSRSRGGGVLPFDSPFRSFMAFDADARERLLAWLLDNSHVVPRGSRGHAEHLAVVGLLLSYRANDLADTGDPGTVQRANQEAVAVLRKASAGLDHDDPVRLVVGQRVGVHLVRLSSSAADGVELLRQAAVIFDDLVNSTRIGESLRSDCLLLYSTAVALLAGLGGDVDRGGAAEALLVEHADDVDQDRVHRARYLGALALLESMTFVKTRRYEDLTASIDYSRRILHILPRTHQLCYDAMSYLALNLVDRFRCFGDLRDADSAHAYLVLLVESVRAGVCVLDERDLVESLLYTRTIVGLDVTEEFEDSDITIAGMSERFEAAVAGTPVDPYTVLGLGTQLADLILADLGGHGDGARLQRAREITSRTLSLMPPNSRLHRLVVIRSLPLDAVGACLVGDEALFSDTVRRAEELLDHPELLPAGVGVVPVLLTVIWMTKHMSRPDRDTADQVLNCFERAVEERHVNDIHFLPALGASIAAVYWSEGGPAEAERAVAIGFELLTCYARLVLLQTGGDHALTRVADAASHSLLLTLRCLSLGDHHSALRAVEAGRGLVLNAASTSANLSTVLRTEGHEVLADEWERAHQVVDAPVEVGEDVGLLSVTAVLGASTGHDDLRQRVLTTLDGTDAGRRLHRTPEVGDVAAALRTTGADVVVHLIPCQGEAYGRALLVYADEHTDEVVFPLLRDDDGTIEWYLRARQESEGKPDDDVARARWEEAVDEIAAWEWTVAAGPLIDRVVARVGRQPHLVLVACGGLGVLPWHAASGPGGRLLLREATVSYASTAQQYCDVASRDRVPLGERPVLVVNPTNDLVASDGEVEYLRRFYPDGRYLGRSSAAVPTSGPGTPDEVRLASRFASMLHLSCHATSGAIPSRSWLRLAEGQKLTVEQILRHVNGDRSLPGGLVVLAACHSDLTAGVHDEVLTLGAAFLVNGATGVIGSRWAVDDVFSSLLMCVFHREMNENGLSPAEALRAAQLWAVDPERVAPPDLPEGLAKRAGDPELRRAHAWAGFTHLGR
ncbi:CHAT domain-containing protein [Umezawaea sp. Da 62-37]|uniref:CHAT domain-containing protein n=1 Tax=Umezawaea sp. Da 62-37 TaxID=3075927 RepID=UPI0028F7071F|nr:CHAT domain-containing protein [Umezawaea sp. Da 62-37]WNV85324.1 CHAT domain-containing protein [Umezawaea sp. Da 62-37]